MAFGIGPMLYLYIKLILNTIFSDNFYEKININYVLKLYRAFCPITCLNALLNNNYTNIKFF